MLRCCSLSVLVGFVGSLGLVGCGSVPDHGRDAGNCAGAACSPYGTGRDGDVSLITAVDITVASLGASSDANGSFADGIAFKVVVNPSGNTITVAGDVTGAIVRGDLVLLINMQGTPDDLGSVGKFEVLEVASAAGSEITLAQRIGNAYGGQDFGNQKIVVQRVPSYSSLAESGGGSITASAWDGLAGAATAKPVTTGIVALLVKGTLSIAGSGIDVSNKGFRGGVAGMHGPEDASNPNLTSGGQSGGPGAIAAAGGKGGGTRGGGAGGVAIFAGGAAGRGGGGGGAADDTNGCGKEGSGGGGAAPYASGANLSSLDQATLTLGGGAAAGGGGGAAGAVENQKPAYAASGGNMNGAGGTLGLAFSQGGSGSAGTAGGGLIFLAAGTFTGPGNLVANGGKGGSGGGGGGGTGYDGSAGGGGGAGANGAAGGSIYVRYGVSTWSGAISVAGGDGGGGGGGGAGDGGGAGGGGGGGTGGGGGGGGTRTGSACGTPLTNAGNGGDGGKAGACGAIVAATDINVGGGGAASGGGGASDTGNCTPAAANAGGLGSPRDNSGGAGNGANGSPTINGGAGGAGGKPTNAGWGGGGGGGQAGSTGATGFTSLGVI